ncbi:hypothetical protein DXG01_005018 [Tephrocybe rancida]|nr:hypothetical protein DXG01_005018 [Tephrocybe rancida]
MRLPTSCNDETLLKDEPFSSDFFILRSGDKLRSWDKRVDESLDKIASKFKEGDQIIDAAKAWIKMAFACPDEKPHRIEFDERTDVGVFVRYYWMLSQREDSPVAEQDANNFLRKERSKRGFQKYWTVTTEKAKKSSHQSHRATSEIKKGVLGENAETQTKPTPIRSPRRGRNVATARQSGAGFKGAKSVSRRFPGPLQINAIAKKASTPSKALRASQVSSPAGPCLPQHSSQRSNSPHFIDTVSEMLDSATQPNTLLSNRQYRHVQPPLTKMEICAEIPLPESLENMHMSVDLQSRPPSNGQTYPNRTGSHDALQEVQPPQNAALLLPSISTGASVIQSAALPVPATEDVDMVIPLGVSIPLLRQMPQHELDTPAHLVRFNTLDESNVSQHLDVSMNEPPYPVETLVKPPLPRYPPVWAQSRQEVCESFDWFRSYQGGVYHTHDYVRGYLLSAFSSRRDIFERGGRFIVSHGGGKAETTQNYQGKSVTQPADDQLAQDKSIRALLTNYRESRPLVLLIDDKYALFPFELLSKEIAYAVLGFYIISHGEPWWTIPQPAQEAHDDVEPDALPSEALENITAASSLRFPARRMHTLEDCTVESVLTELQRTIGFEGKIRLPKEFWNEKLPVSFLDHCLEPSTGIIKDPLRLFPIEAGMAQVQTFVLPNASGLIHHIQALTPTANKDADTIFELYQDHASTGRGPLLTNYFSQNSGEPYQVCGTANTVPFSETSSAVRGARDLIQSRIRQALGMDCEFNEVLSDSEHGLGPVVAGLSLGSPALMHFRIHSKYLRMEDLECNSIALTVILRHVS